MEHIDENRIRCALQNYILKGKVSFVIFPYGVKGRMAKRVLNDEFGICELGIADNLLSKGNNEILSLDDLKKIEQDYVLLFASDRLEIREELWHELRKKFHGEIVDLASVKLSIKEDFDFADRPLIIEVCDQEQTKEIFERTQRSWEKLGVENPYWSVVTHDEFQKENLNEEAIEKFYTMGIRNAAEIAWTLLRTQRVKKWLDLKNLDILEIGCGCGRVTKSLSSVFRKVIAIDISAGNLAIAKKEIQKNNVEYFHLKSLDDYKKLPQADIVYSYLVLQHNCPPVIEYIIDAMLKCLRPYGVAIFQIPTYKKEYSFKYEEYMKDEADLGIEMHLLTQEKIFEIGHVNCCIPLEVYPYKATGQADHSTMFVLKKLKV